MLERGVVDAADLSTAVLDGLAKVDEAVQEDERGARPAGFARRQPSLEVGAVRRGCRCAAATDKPQRADSGASRVLVEPKLPERHAHGSEVNTLHQPLELVRGAAARTTHARRKPKECLARLDDRGVGAALRLRAAE